MALSGNEHFAALWTAAQRSVGAYVASIITDFHEAEEILQRVAVVLLRKFAQFEPGTSFVAWAIQVAKYEILAHRRQRSTDRHHFDHELLDTIAAAHARAADDGPQFQAMRDCLKGVRGKARQAIDLRYAEGFTPAELAERMGLQPAAARMLLMRVRNAVRECIERKLATGGDPR